MKRDRSEIYQSIVTNEQIIFDCYQKINESYENISVTTIELDNYDLQQHQSASLAQFEVWKKEFLNNHSDSVYFPVLQSLLSNTQQTWTVKCNSDGQDDIRFYSNRLLLSLNNTLFFNMLYYVIPNQNTNINNFTVSSQKFSANMTKNVNDDLYDKLAESIGLDRDTFFDLVALCYFAFMFNPQIPSEIYCPSSLPSTSRDIVLSYGLTRCKNEIEFSSRYSWNNDKRLKSMESQNVEFMSLYDPCDNDEDNDEDNDDGNDDGNDDANDGEVNV
ncbi:hypothetical protein Indivirus_2_117 [Indivirus ILV1]|uniref:Uncharacterized protein n=1 Tax=Indivirus ILV1 TaxID=1977633 RepID=A0A1V0SDK7_9VIRU|nr:hypothetical protein Indivirus_2_117 [Indivirus ILV1]